MQRKTRRIGTLLAYALSSLIVAPYAHAAPTTPVQGEVKVQLNYVFATTKSGEPDTKPGDNAACRKQTSSPDSRYLGVTVSTWYSIDPQSLIMSARSTLPSPQSHAAVELNIPLSALGIAGQYAFGAFRPPTLPNTYVLFSMGLDFKAAKSSILIENAGIDYNCLVSSDPKPFGDALSAKYGTAQN